MRICFIVIAALALSTCPMSLQAEMILFTHTDTTTDFSGLGGGTGSILKITMDNGGTGTLSQTWSSNASNFVSASFVSGSYSATYNATPDGVKFQTDAAGNLIEARFSSLIGVAGSDSKAGIGIPRLDIVISDQYRFLDSLGTDVRVNQEEWNQPTNVNGWTVSAAAIPEPSSFAMFALAGFLFGSRRRSSSARSGNRP